MHKLTIEAVFSVLLPVFCYWLIEFYSRFLLLFVFNSYYFLCNARRDDFSPAPNCTTPFSIVSKRAATANYRVTVKRQIALSGHADRKSAIHAKCSQFQSQRHSRSSSAIGFHAMFYCRVAEFFCCTNFGGVYWNLRSFLVCNALMFWRRIGNRMNGMKSLLP